MPQQLTLNVKFFIESDMDPETVATDFEQGLSAFGGPILEAAERFPGGEVTGAEVESIRPANDDEIAVHFEE